MVTSEQRRRQLAREKYERQLQHREEAARKRKSRNAIVGASVALVVIAGVSAFAAGVFDSAKKPAAADQASSAPAAPKAPGKQWPSEPAMTIDTKANYTATLDMTGGKVTIALDAAKAPHTVNSFNFLSGQQYFDGTKCHRLTTQGIYVLQCGDPTATGAPGSGGSGGPGYSFTDENLTDATYPAGTLAMANSGPNTNGSQFFLVYKDTQLPPNYTPFGKISGGLDVIQKIAAAGTADGSGDGAPAKPVVLNKVTTVKG